MNLIKSAILLVIVLRSDDSKPRMNMVKVVDTKLTMQVTQSRKNPSSRFNITSIGSKNEMIETMEIRTMTSVRYSFTGKSKTPLAMYKRTNTKRK